MKTFPIGRIYEILLQSISNYPQSTANPQKLKKAVAQKDRVFVGDIESFLHHYNKLEDAIKTGDVKLQTESLVYLRTFAMNISTDFSNLADSIEDVAFTYGDS
ncbi:hypothetical protein [Gimesia algae]|uniref:Uncharacterized protein n=1 Tax=Gimesia algae TaxID=2527971 RepID=A0A517VCY7_9PLAN|nr:hypothetical protein [Gimesia algae]QDT90876.1 hypothetical protein Pan161_25300 [Gimesia algae]